MSCKLEYKGRVFTRDEFKSYVDENPSEFETYLKPEHFDSVLGDQAEALGASVQGVYKDLLKQDPVQVLFEAAVQSNSSEADYHEAVRIFGQPFIDLAQKTFPTAKPGSSYTPNENEINYRFKAVQALRSDKVRQPSVLKFQGFLNDLQKAGLSKTQIETIESLYEAGMDKNDLIVSYLANNAYTVEIDTAMRTSNEKGLWEVQQILNDTFIATHRYTEYNSPVFETREEAQKWIDSLDGPTPTSNYIGLTVPGGVNYRENEIKTPDITPAIKGHAAFATDQGIGWFRSDEESNTDTPDFLQDEFNGDEPNVGEAYQLRSLYEAIAEEKDEIEKQKLSREIDKINKTIEDSTKKRNELKSTKTRRILEVQSDLFQKGRDKKDLISKGIVDRTTYEGFSGETDIEQYLEGYRFSLEEESYQGTDKKSEKEINALVAEERVKLENKLLNKEFEKLPANQFLQLLNKDNNWVTFFVKAIIQDSAKKGYEKVLFPSGNTAAKVEGHDDLQTFIKQKEQSIARAEVALQTLKNEEYFDLHERENVVSYFKQGVSDEEGNESTTKFKYYVSGRGDTKVITEGEFNTAKGQLEQSILMEIEQFQKEIKQAQEGTLQISAIAKFYETDIQNILKKKGYEPKRITDEHGNDWFEVNVPNSTEPISFDSMTVEQATREILKIYKPVILHNLQDGTPVIDNTTYLVKGYKMAERMKEKLGFGPSGIVTTQRMLSQNGKAFYALRINENALSSALQPKQGEFFDSTLSDLATGLKQAVITQEKIDHQIGRTIEEATKLEKKINSIDNKTVRSRLRTALKLLQDPEKQKDVNNFIYFLIESSETLKFYAERLKKIETLPIESKINDLERAIGLAENFKDLITFLDREFKLIDDRNEFKKLIDDLSKYKNEIQIAYESEAEKVAVEKLGEYLKGDEKIAFDKLQGEIDKDEALLRKYRENGSPESLIKTVLKRVEALKKSRELYIPSSEMLSDTFKGLRGDIGWVSGNLRSAIAMGDPVISTFARKLKEGFNKVRQVLIPIKNQAYNALTTYEKALGLSRNLPMSKFYEGLYQIQDSSYVDDNGEIQSESYYSLLTPFTEKFYNDKLGFENEIKQLKLKGAPIDEVRAAQDKYSEWLDKYAERRYKPEWYNRYNLLNPEAEQARQDIIDEQNNILRDSRDTLTEAQLERLHELKHEFKRLGSLRDKEGNLKTGDDLKIAESIQKFNKETAKMSFWEITEENREWFNIMMGKKKEQLDKGLIDQGEYDRWYSLNTQRLIKQDFYKERQIIIDTIQSLMSKLPKEQFKEDIKKLWDDIIDISKPYRDDDNILAGDEVTKPEAEKVKEKEESIEALKAKLIRFSGLTVEEERELSGLWGSLESLTDAEIRRFVELRDQKESYGQYIKSFLSDGEFTLLMKSFASLASISRWTPTEYYREIYNSKLHEFRATYDPSFQKDLKEVEEAFISKSEWYSNNHVSKTKKVVSDDGHTYFTTVDEPIYIWKDIIPTNPDYIEKDAPGFAFRTRVVKPDFINPNFKVDVKGRILPKRQVGTEPIQSPYVNEDYERLRINSNVDPRSKAKWDMLQYLTKTHLEAQVGDNLTFSAGVYSLNDADRDGKIPNFKRLGYFLPGVMKEEYDRVLDKGVKGVVTGFKQLFKTTQEDKDLMLGDVSQIELSVIPIKFSNKVKPDDQNLNLLETILRHRAATEEYEYLESQIGEAKIISSALKTAQQDVSPSAITRVLKALGYDKFIKADKQSRRSKVFDEFVRTMFYGETEHAFPAFFGNKDTNKLLNSALGIASTQIMTFNFPAHLTNLLSGEIQNIIEAFGGKYYNFKDYLRAKAIYSANVGKFWNDYKREGEKTFWSALADRLDVPQGEFYNEFGKKTAFSRLRSFKAHVMIIKHTGEHEMQVSTMIAMAINRKVKINGDVQPLYKALSYVNGQIKIKDGVKNIDGTDFSENDLNRFQDKVHSVVRQLNGAYSKIDRSVAEKSFLGKLAYYMRKYFVPMAFRRFETFKYDYEEQEFKEGYYVTAWRILGDIIKLNKNIFTNWSNYTSSLSDEEKRNAKAFMSEVLIIGALAMFVLAMGGYDKDRKLQGRWLHTMALYEFMKMKSEAETFLPLPGAGVNELTTLFRSPFAASATITTTGRILNDFSNMFSDMVTGQSNSRFNRDYGIWKDGDLRIKADILKLIGFNGNILTPENLIKNFELRNR